MSNNLVEAAKSGRQPAYWRTAIYLIVVIGLPLLATGGITLLILGILALTGRVSPSNLPDFTQNEILFFTVGLIFELLTIAITLIWVAVIDKRAIRTIGLDTRSPFAEWLRGLAVGAGLMLLAVGVMAAFGAIQTNGSSLQNPAALLGVIGALFFFLIQGPAEEVIFRGYLLPVLSARGTLAIGVVVSSVLFGLIHSLNPNVALLPILNITLAGVMFALYALVEEGIWGVFGLHSAWNWVQGNVLGLAVSGGEFGPSLFKLQENGPDWLTGGLFGPEGSLVVTLLLTLTSAYLGWRLWGRRTPASTADPTAS